MWGACSWRPSKPIYDQNNDLISHDLHGCVFVLAFELHLNMGVKKERKKPYGVCSRKVIAYNYICKMNESVGCSFMRIFAFPYKSTCITLSFLALQIQSNILEFFSWLSSNFRYDTSGMILPGIPDWVARTKYSASLCLCLIWYQNLNTCILGLYMPYFLD